MILTVLALAVLARSIGGLTEARRNQDSAAALAAAEAGLSDAVVHIRLDPSTDLTGAGSLRAAGFRWTAHRVDTAHFSVSATGTAGAVRRVVAGTVSRPSRFPYALFSDQDIVVDGGVSIASGAVGSNHALVVQGAAGTRQDWFSPSGSCSSCPAGNAGLGPRRVALPDAPTDARPCPIGGAFTGVISRGEYVCQSDVTFGGSVVLGPGSDPLVVHVTGALILNAASVNAGGAAADVQLFVAGGQVHMGEGSTETIFVGALEAPNAQLTLGTNQVDVTGAVSVGSIDARPGPHAFRHDDGLDDVQAGGWTLSDWHQAIS
jgi:hypothetical protein